MLSDQERATLAEIERKLVEDDPQLDHVMRSLSEPIWWQPWRKRSGKPE